MPSNLLDRRAFIRSERVVSLVRKVLCDTICSGIKSGQQLKHWPALNALLSRERIGRPNARKKNFMGQQSNKTSGKTPTQVMQKQSLTTQILLLGLTLHGHSHHCGQSGSAVPLVSPPNLLLTPASCKQWTEWETEGLDTVPALPSNS